MRSLVLFFFFEEVCTVPVNHTLILYGNKMTLKLLLNHNRTEKWLMQCCFHSAVVFLLKCLSLLPWVGRHVTSLGTFREKAANSSKDIWGVWAQYVTVLPSVGHICLQMLRRQVHTRASLLRDRSCLVGLKRAVEGPPPLGIFYLTTFGIE